MRVTPSTLAASSVSRALSVVGDRWALRIIDDSFAGIRRFEEFRARSGAARSIVASRLSCLVASGVLERVRYSDAPPRSEYRLSTQGAELYGVTLLCSAWEAMWMPGRNGTASNRLHQTCGRSMKPVLVCGDCGGPVTFHNTEYELVATQAARKSPTPNFRRLSSAAGASSGDAGQSLAHVTDIIGDRWTLLILSAGFLGLRRFDAIQSTLRIATNILTHRLNRLVASGLLRRRLYSQHPPRCEYCMTQKGLDLFPLVAVLSQWADRWLAPRCSENLWLLHRECGRRLRAIVACDHCASRLEPGDVVSPS